MNRAMGGIRAGNDEFRYRVHATSMDSRQGAGALCSVRESVTGRTECVRRARSGLWGEGRGNAPSYPATRVPKQPLTSGAEPRNSHHVSYIDLDSIVLIISNLEPIST